MRFTIYSKQGCPFCDQIKLLFELNEFKFVEYKLDRDFDREEFTEKFGDGSTFPQVDLIIQHNLWAPRQPAKGMASISQTSMNATCRTATPQACSIRT